MDYLTIVLMSIGLSMDAFTVSICDALSIKKITKWQEIFIPLMFGLFQALFPLIGYYIGQTFIDYIDAYDHYVSFGLLLLIGGKMVYDGIKEMKESKAGLEKEEKKFSYGETIVQAVATAIDALAVGIALTSSVMKLSIFVDIAFIGSITFLICLAGIFLGKVIVKLLKGKYEISEVIGGIVLILLGVKLLLSGIGVINF
jgi:putative Mn2+ efflux pump MntP